MSSIASVIRQEHEQERAEAWSEFIRLIVTYSPGEIQDSKELRRDINQARRELDISDSALDGYISAAEEMRSGWQIEEQRKKLFEICQTASVARTEAKAKCIKGMIKLLAEFKSADVAAEIARSRLDEAQARQIRFDRLRVGNPDIFAALQDNAGKQHGYSSSQPSKMTAPDAVIEGYAAKQINRAEELARETVMKIFSFAEIHAAIDSAPVGSNRD